MDLRHLGIPFLVYPQGDLRSYPASRYDDTLPREFAEINSPEPRGRDRASSTRTGRRPSPPQTPSRAQRSAYGNNTQSRQSDVFTGPATLVRAPPGNRANTVSMDYALEELEGHLKDARKFYASYIQEYDERAQGVNYFAMPNSLDNLWQNFLDKKFENPYEKVKFTSMMDKISRGIQEVKMIAAVGGMHNKSIGSERNARKAQKLSNIGDEITKLSGRAAREKMACDYLVDDLDDAIQVIRATSTYQQTSPHISNDNNDAMFGNHGQENHSGDATYNQQGNDHNASQQNTWTSS